MKRMAPKSIKQAVLVIGDDASDKMAFIQKCTQSASLARTLPFGNHRVELAFTAADPSISNELASSADVIIFCYNVNQVSSYEAMLACLNRVHQHYQGILAVVACVGHNVHEPFDAEIKKMSQQLDLMLNRVHPQTTLPFCISRNNDDACGVSQLLLNLLADKALKRNEAKPVSVVVEIKEPARVKPSYSLNGLVLGAEGVGKSSVICQAVGYPDAALYKHKLEPVNQLLEFAERDVFLTLTDTSSGGALPKGKAHFAILCFDLNNLKTLTFVYDQIKRLIAQDKKILFALLGNKRDLVLSDDSQKGVADEVKLLTATLAELYPYHFMGLYLNSTVDKRYNQVPLLANILCENYCDKWEEEKALVSKFKQAHQSMPTHLFSRTNIPESADLDMLIHNASREDVETRSNMVFKTLGWFDRRGHLAPDAPELLKQRRHSLDMAGISYAKKLNSGS